MYNSQVTLSLDRHMAASIRGELGPAGVLVVTNSIHGMHLKSSNLDSGFGFWTLKKGARF